ncbi:MAG TPA: Gfo/Idh/MocA family oxidoreductase [Pseudonocardiaceae bacterium]|nr:Gfo/Idh/MocA family oxidoreductase [Pseudonocardiaceae bacterium]
MNTIRVAVFGVGGWARQVLLPALRADPDVEVVAGVDPVTDNAAITPTYRTLDELFAADDNLDLLVIAAPDHLHVDAARAALERGIAVYCEKPLGNSAPAAEELAALAETTGVPATVGYSFRYGPAVQAMRADLADGTLGDVWLIELYEQNAQFHPLLGKPMNWKGDAALVAAGALLEYGSHVLDLCQWLVGPVASVSSNLVRVLPDAQVDDLATLQLRFANGANGTLLCSWVLTGGYPGITIRLHTSTGLAEVRLIDLIDGAQQYRRWHPDGTPLPVAELPTLADGPGAYARLHVDDLLATMRAGGASASSTLPTLRHAALTHRVLEAATAATAEWQQVRETQAG